MVTARSALWSLVTLLGTTPAPAADGPPSFERDVLPILRARCWKCHGTAQRKACARGGRLVADLRGDRGMTHPFQGCSRGSHAGTARRYASYSSPNCRRSTGSS